VDRGLHCCISRNIIRGRYTRDKKNLRFLGSISRSAAEVERPEVRRGRRTASPATCIVAVRRGRRTASPTVRVVSTACTSEIPSCGSVCCSGADVGGPEVELRGGLPADSYRSNERGDNGAHSRLTLPAKWILRVLECRQ
jgi:hypothetical protein